MDLHLELTEEEDLIVKDYRDKVDKYLEIFKRSRELKTVTNTNGCVLFKEIINLEKGVIKSALTRYLASRPELFQIFRLAWNCRLRGNIPPSINSTNLSRLSVRLGNLTDVSDDICLAFGERGLLRMLMENLKTGEIDYGLTRNALTVICNCCRRVSENRIICREYVDVLQDLSHSTKSDIQADAFLALSYVVDKSETHKISLNGSCVKFLLLHLRSSMGESHRQSSSKCRYSAVEIIQGINQLAINESNKLLIVELGGLDLLQRILMEGSSSDEERLWAARGIWRLAFQEGNKAKIRRTKTLISILQRIKQTTTNLHVQEACSGALFVINDVIEVEDEVDEVKGDAQTRKSLGPRQKSSTESHIMISYQWASQQPMLLVKSYLEKRGYDVWMDVDRMKGNILNAMAAAVQNASVVLVCASKKYSESQNCRTEAQYAYKQKKDIIPLMVEDQFEPKGWLGALMGMAKYFPVYSCDVMEQSLPDLVRELGDRGKREEPGSLALDEKVTGASFSTVHTDDVMKKNGVDASGGVNDDEPAHKKNMEDGRLHKFLAAVKNLGSLS